MFIEEDLDLKNVKYQQIKYRSFSASQNSSPSKFTTLRTTTLSAEKKTNSAEYLCTSEKIERLGKTLLSTKNAKNETFNSKDSSLLKRLDSIYEDSNSTINFKKYQNFTCSTSIKKQKDHEYSSENNYHELKNQLISRNFSSTEISEQRNIIEHNLDENSQSIRILIDPLDSIRKEDTSKSNYESLIQNESSVQITHPRGIVSASQRSNAALPLQKSSLKSNFTNSNNSLKDIIINSPNVKEFNPLDDECPSFRNLNGVNVINEHHQIEIIPKNFDNYCDSLKKVPFSFNSVQENSKNPFKQEYIKEEIESIIKEVKFDSNNFLAFTFQSTQKAADSTRNIENLQNKVNNSPKSSGDCYDNLESLNEIKHNNEFTDDSSRNTYREKDAKENMHKLAKEIKSFESKFGKMNLDFDLNLISKMLYASNEKQNTSVTEFDKDHLSRLIQTLTNRSSENITSTDRLRYELSNLSKEYEDVTVENQSKCIIDDFINVLVQKQEIYSQNLENTQDYKSLHCNIAPMSAPLTPNEVNDNPSTLKHQINNNIDHSSHPVYLDIPIAGPVACQQSDIKKIPECSNDSGYYYCDDLMNSKSESANISSERDIPDSFQNLKHMNSKKVEVVQVQVQQSSRKIIQNNEESLNAPKIDFTCSPSDKILFRSQHQFNDYTLSKSQHQFNDTCQELYSSDSSKKIHLLNQSTFGKLCQSYDPGFFNNQNTQMKGGDQIDTYNLISYRESIQNYQSKETHLKQFEEIPINFPLDHNALLTPVNPFDSNHVLNKTNLKLENCGSQKSNQIHSCLQNNNIHDENRVKNGPKDFYLNEFTYPPVNVILKLSLSTNLIRIRSRRNCFHLMRNQNQMLNRLNCMIN